MIQRSISLPNKPPEDNQQRLERSEEIEELCEELSDSDDDDEFIKFGTKINDDKYCHSDSDSIISDENCIETNLSEEANKEENKIKVSKNNHRIELQENFQDNNENFGRVIDKNGKRNVNLLKIPRRSLRFCKDIVTTLIEQQWRYTLIVFIGSSVLSWVIFTALWYLVAYAHGDLLFDENGKRLGEDKVPCIVGVKNLLDIFIYTVETQTTIGFGEKYSTEECPESVFLFVVHIIVSIALDGALVGIIYAKISRPVKNVSRHRFSKKAVICTRDDKLCFIFRVCDPVEQQTIDTRINAFILMDTKTTEGEILLKARKELKIVDNNKSPILIWPETICHIIDEHSPLYECIQGKEFCKKFEIYVSLIGSSPSLGQMTESKTSYLPCEIEWDHHFFNIILYDWEKDCYFIDYNNFNTIIPIKENIIN